MSERLEVDVIYRYGWRGRIMLAIRSPINDTPDGEHLCGARVRFGDKDFVINAVHRVLKGPIARGEPLGVAVEQVS